MKRAQLAVETLLIYGVAILIVTLAVYALFATGFLDFDSFVGDSCKISKELACGEYVVRGDPASVQQIQLEIENTYGKNVNVQELRVVGEDDYEGILTGCNSSTAQVIPNGDTLRFDLIDCGDLTNFVGKKAKAEIQVTWNAAGSTISRTSYGQLRATVTE